MCVCVCVCVATWMFKQIYLPFREEFRDSVLRMRNDMCLGWWTKKKG